MGESHDMSAPCPQEYLQAGFGRTWVHIGRIWQDVRVYTDVVGCTTLDDLVDCLGLAEFRRLCMTLRASQDVPALMGDRLGTQWLHSVVGVHTVDMVQNFVQDPSFHLLDLLDWQDAHVQAEVIVCTTLYDLVDCLGPAAFHRLCIAFRTSRDAQALVRDRPGTRWLSWETLRGAHRVRSTPSWETLQLEMMQSFVLDLSFQDLFVQNHSKS